MGKCLFGYLAGVFAGRVKWIHSPVMRALLEHEVAVAAGAGAEASVLVEARECWSGYVQDANSRRAESRCGYH